MYTNDCIAIKNEDEIEFSDTNKPSNLTKEFDQKISVCLENEKLVDLNNCYYIKDANEEEFLHNASIPDALQATSSIEICKTEYTYDESTINTAKRLENKSTTLENGFIIGLLEEYVCEFCFKSFAQHHHLKSHLNVHSDLYKKALKKPRKSNACNKKSKASKVNNKDQQKQSLKANNTKEKYSKCNIIQMDDSCAICNKIFSNQQDLIKHAQEIHLKAKALKCRECNECFFDTTSLSRHVKFHKEIPKQSVRKNISSKTKEEQIESEQLNKNNETNEDSFKFMSLEENSSTNENLRRQTNDCDKSFQILGSESKMPTETIIGEHDKNLTSFDNTHSGAETIDAKRKHKCKFCLKTFRFNSCLQRHTMIHTGERPFSCSTCNMNFTNNSSLQRHITTHTGERPYPCSICNMAFRRKEALKRHKQKIHLAYSDSDEQLKITKERQKCKFCLKTFGSYTTLQIHLTIHTGERPYTCSICSSSFRRRHHLKTHKRMHLDPKLLKKRKKHKTCDFCSKFVLKANLKEHIMMHTGELPFSCTLCKESFKREVDLRRHQQRHLKSESKTMSDLNILDKKCAACSKIIYNKQDLVNHAKEVHTSDCTPFKCRYCDSTFSTMAYLRQHCKFFHVDDTENRLYSCAICQETFINNANLRFHEQHHRYLTEISHIVADDCAICNENFKSHPDLTEHVRTCHPKGNPFKCRDCNRTFSKVGSVAYHYKKIHRDELNKLDTEDITKSECYEN